MKNDGPQVLIVGAGLAGLSCAVTLYRSGISFFILEAANRIGGRVQTDRFEGFLLDRGFQVLQTAYPEAQRMLDTSALHLQPFSPGAVIRWNGGFHVVADPVRLPRYFLNSIFSPIGTFGDKLRMMRLARCTTRGTLRDLFDRPEYPTAQYLRRQGFSERIIERFFRPFFSGVCLDPQIRVSSRVFEFVFRMFAQGDVALPAEGMGAIPRQLVAQIPPSSIRTATRVRSVSEGGLTLEQGETLSGAAVVLATEAPEAARLLGLAERPASCEVSCLYYAAKRPPLEGKLLILNAEGRGPVHSLTVVSNVAPSYAAPGHALVNVVILQDNTLEEASLENEVRRQLTQWFGPQIAHWRHLRAYRIAHALPLQIPPLSNPTRLGPQPRAGVYVCGEYGGVAGIQWALLSGRLTAERIVEDLKTP